METKTTNERSKYLFLSGLFIGIILLGVGIFAILENTSGNKLKKGTILTHDFIEDIFGEGFMSTDDKYKLENEQYLDYNLLKELEDRYLSEVNQTDNLLVTLKGTDGKNAIEFDGKSLYKLRQEYVKDSIYASTSPNDLADSFVNFTTYMVYEMLKEYIYLNELLDITEDEFKNYLEYMYGFDGDLSDLKDGMLLKFYQTDYIDKLILLNLLTEQEFVSDETYESYKEYEGNIRQKVVTYSKTGTDFEDIVDVDKEIEEFVKDVETFNKSYTDATLEELFNYLTKQKGYNEEFITFTDVTPLEVYNNKELMHVEEHYFTDTSTYKGNNKVRVSTNPYIMSVSYIYNELELTELTMRIADTLNHVEFGVVEFDGDKVNILNYLKETYKDHFTFTKDLENILKEEYLLNEQVNDIVEEVFKDYQEKLIELSIQRDEERAKEEQKLNESHD